MTGTTDTNNAKNLSKLQCLVENSKLSVHFHLKKFLIQKKIKLLKTLIVVEIFGVVVTIVVLIFIQLQTAAISYHGIAT